MKVLHITAWWPSRVYPTHGNFIEKHVRLVAREHEVVVVAVQEDYTLPSGHLDMDRSSELEYECIVIYYGRSNSTSRVSNLTNRARAYLYGLRQVVPHWGRPPNIVHGHILIDGGIIASLIARWWRIPYVISEHASIYRQPGAVGRFRLVLARWAARNASSILPVSDYLRELMQSIHHIVGRYKVIPNVVNSDLFNLPPSDQPRPHAPFRLLHISNFEDRAKNIEGLLAAYRLVQSQQCCRLTMRLAGDGDLVKLKERVTAYGLTDYVTLSGPHTEEEVAALMQEADAFILFSRYETQGVVLLEAQLCGLPCIASRVGGVQEVVADEQSGYLVRAGDVLELAKAIHQMVDRYQLFCAALIRKQALSKYSEQAVAFKFREVYAHALQCS